jgi:hypothetical protein
MADVTQQSNTALAARHGIARELGAGAAAGRRSSAVRRLGPTLLLVLGSTAPRPAPAQATADASARALAVAEAALDAISRGDMIAFTDLMVDEAITFRVATGRPEYGVRTRAEIRTGTPSRAVTERGFGATVHVSGPLALVWLPYDLYLDGEWSHCGVDAFTLLRVGSAWKIASVAWSVEQPPDCLQHPNGPPRR